MYENVESFVGLAKKIIANLEAQQLSIKDFVILFSRHSITAKCDIRLRDLLNIMFNMSLYCIHASKPNIK